jgi:hypothetical protein
MGWVVVGLDGADGDEMAQVRLDSVGMEPHPPGVVPCGIGEPSGPTGTPFDVAVKEGNAHSDGGTDGQPPAEVTDQGARQVGHGAARRRAVGGAVEAGSHGQCG